MTDGTYTGLDDGTILERLTGQAEDLSGDSHSNGSAAGVAGPHGTRSELRARLSTLMRRDEYPAPPSPLRRRCRPPWCCRAKVCDGE
jgi:hypothetical protein